MAFERRGRERDRHEQAEDDSGLQEKVVQIYRCAKVVKGGRKFSFSALVVVGDGAGKVGIGYGKANEVPLAVEKSRGEATKEMFDVPLRGNTIPHKVVGRFGASKIILIPASPGTGVIAGKNIRPLFELAGIQDLLTKAYGSSCPKNLLRAGVDGLMKLRSAEQIKKLRGVEVL